MTVSDRQIRTFSARKDIMTLSQMPITTSSPEDGAVVVGK